MKLIVGLGNPGREYAYRYAHPASLRTPIWCARLPRPELQKCPAHSRNRPTGSAN